MGESIRLYEWIQERFVPGSAEAEAAIELIGPRLRPLVSAGSRVLDLCCGAGVWSVWMASLGAHVEGVDLSDAMIERARSEIAERQLNAAFFQGDVSERDHGEERFDLVLLMGNSVADLSPSAFEKTAESVHRALVPGGRLLIHHLDGDAYLAEAQRAGGGIEQTEPERITWVFTDNLPERRCWVATYTNCDTGEQYEYTTYVHTPRSIGEVLETGFECVLSFALTERSRLEVWSRRPGGESTLFRPR